MRCEIVRTQKLIWHNIMRSTKSQKVSVLHYSTSRKHVRCTGKLLKMKYKNFFFFFLETMPLTTLTNT